MLAIVSLSGTVYAQDGETVDNGAAQATLSEEPIASVNIDLEAATRAKADKRAQAKRKKRTMQSCLTLVRSYYGNEDATV